jgi:CRP/FNR family cyclic AMP-dependent transcriptional regulator
MIGGPDLKEAPWPPKAHCICLGIHRTENGLRATQRTGQQSETAWSWKRDLFLCFFYKGRVVLLEGQRATGVFLMRGGTAKESMVSSSGRIAIIRVVGPGVILGLSAALGGTPHESTVEALEPCHADFLEKTMFLHLLKTSSRLGKTVAGQLNRDCKDAYASVRRLGLSGSVSGKLARLILHWAESPMANDDKNAAKIRIRVILTREEIGQAMGTTRETTSRMLGGIPGKTMDHHARQRLDD